MSYAPPQITEAERAAFEDLVKSSMARWNETCP